MSTNRAGRTQEFVAINGGAPSADEVHRLREEVDRLRAQIAVLEQDLEEERARSAGMYAQLTVASRQLEASSTKPARGRLRGRTKR